MAQVTSLRVCRICGKPFRVGSATRCDRCYRAEVDIPATRRCMSCGKTFKPEGATQRRCPRCHNQEQYGSIRTLPQHHISGARLDRFLPRDLVRELAQLFREATA